MRRYLIGLLVLLATMVPFTIYDGPDPTTRCVVTVVQGEVCPVVDDVDPVSVIVDDGSPF
jgi:hypothetical protein